MNVFSWISIIVSILYGGLTIIGGGIQLKKRKIGFWSSIIMITGGVLIILSVLDYKYEVYSLISGLAIIHVSAINNGYKMYRKINIIHHVIRLMLSLLIITLFLLK